jgi:uncharacterized protein YprB with RNaseH-like and TPR domain
LDPASPDDGAGSKDPAYTVGDVLGGEWCESDDGRFLVVDRSYSPGHRHGWMSIADGLPPTDGVWPRLSLLASGACPERGQGSGRVEGNLLFVDLETTGIAGGAGTYAFLVGCAWFDQGRFRVRQFFLTSFLAERALLRAVMDIARTAGTVVTYNGKTFDLPLVETRFTMHRMETPFATMPHIDMLHPARRLWRGRTADGSSAVDAPGRDSCRLSVMEQSLCGHIREGDVAGFEIPARYFQFVRTGDARPLEAVFEHNRLDLLSLALVTARAAQLLDEGAPATRTAREALGLGRLYERGGLTTDAWRCYTRAIELDDEDVVTRADALRAHAVLSRRMRRFEDAASLWRRLVEMPQCPAPMRREASEALAVHLEHRLRDYQTAKGYAMTSLDASTSVARRQATLHRMARLDRKINDMPGLKNKPGLHYSLF